MNTKKIISTLVFITILPNLALAQNIPSPEPDETTKNMRVLPPLKLQPGEKDPGAALSPMKLGQRAPFTGVLLSPGAVANVIVELESFEKRLHIEVMRSVSKEQAAGDKRLSNANVGCVADKKELQANLDASKRETNAYKTELNNIKDSRPNPYIWAGLGALGGAAFTLLTVFAVTQVTK
jgi:hypothetical protein